MSGAGFDVIVIGGGSNGLVAASRLGRAGRRVLLVEAADRLGGMRRVVEIAPGFRAAPLSLDPGWIPPTVLKGLGIERPASASVDAAASVAVGPGETLTLSRDPAQATAAIRHRSHTDAEKWGPFTARLRRLAGFLEELYAVEPPDVGARSLGEILSALSLARKFRALGPVEMIELLRTLPMSIRELLDDTFESSLLKAAVAPAGVWDHRQGPRSNGTGLVLLHYLVGAEPGTVRGRRPWRDGPDALTKALEQAARDASVTLRTAARVERIRVRDDAVAGVVLASGEEISTRAVISTAAPATTLLDWVDPVWLDPELIREIGNVRHRGCTAIVAYALDALPEVPGLSPQALAGIVSLTADTTALERAADAAKYGTISDRLHVELSVPTQIWPAMAPSGGHVAVARATYAPYRLDEGRWDDARREALADRVTAAIAGIVPAFPSAVRGRVAWSPADLERDFGLREGAATQGELGLDQILFMRPAPLLPRHATSIRGLYLGGCGTHPGPGVLGGAGWLAAGRAIDAAAGRR